MVVVRTTGGAREVVDEDDEHRLELLGGRVRSLPGVRSAGSSVHLRACEQRHGWGHPRARGTSCPAVPTEEVLATGQDDLS